MIDVLEKHEARKQVVDRSRFPAVRPQHERVEPPLTEKHIAQIIFTQFEFISLIHVIYFSERSLVSTAMVIVYYGKHYTPPAPVNEMA